MQHRLQSARSRAQAPWPPTSPHRIPRVWVCQNGGAEHSAEMLVHRAVGALVVRCQDGKDNAGASHAKKVRRLGRPAWKRSPDDTPLRDGNRDRIQGALWTAMHAARIRLSLPSLTPRGELPTGVAGMLTTAAVKTLLAYTTETNQQLHHWCGPSAHPRVALREPVVVGP